MTVANSLVERVGWRESLGIEMLKPVRNDIRFSMMTVGVSWIKIPI
jgi:hypothetical protein